MFLYEPCANSAIVCGALRVNPYVMNGLSHPYNNHLDESTFIFRGIRSIFLFFLFLDETR